MGLKRTNSDDPDFGRLVVDLDKYLAEVDGDQHSYYAQFNGIAEIPNVVVAYEGDEPIGCGAFKRYDDSTVEIKRMYVAPDQRGKRIGAEILSELELWASELRFAATILETGRKQIAAIALYQNSGYEVIPNYDQYAGIENSVCMKKLSRPRVRPRYDRSNTQKPSGVFRCTSGREFFSFNPGSIKFSIGKEISNGSPAISPKRFWLRWFR